MILSLRRQLATPGDTVLIAPGEGVLLPSNWQRLGMKYSGPNARSAQAGEPGRSLNLSVR